MSVEAQLITKLIDTQDWDSVDEQQIKAKFFNGIHKRAFKFIQDFKTKYGKVPSKQEFLKKFPAFPLLDEEPPEPISYYCDEVRTKTVHNMIVDGIEDASENLENLETNAAHQILKKMLMAIENEVIKGDTKRINEDTDKRWEAYIKRRNMGGITGTPTGLEPFDKVTGGLGETDLITVLGYTGVGKTWFLIILGVLLAKEGYKVLFVTREMSTTQVEKRADAVWANISYSDFNRGQLTPQDEQRFKEYLEEMEGNEEANLIFELSTGGVSNVAALVDKHEPDVLLIDGGYLMTDDADDRDWKGISETWQGFKRIALERKLPIVVTMQLKANKASLDNIALAKYIAQDCDVILGMEQTDEMKAVKEVKFKPLKLRDSDAFITFVLNWDFNKMNYTPVYIEGLKMELSAEDKAKVSKNVQQLEE